MTDFVDDVLDGLEEFVAQMEDNGLADPSDPGVTGARLVRLRDARDRIDRLMKDTTALLGDSGVEKFEVDGVPYKLRQSVSYKWDMAAVFEQLREAAKRTGISELEAVQIACSVSTARVTGLRTLEIEPDSLREAKPGAWRIEGPRARSADAEADAEAGA